MKPRCKRGRVLLASILIAGIGGGKVVGQIFGSSSPDPGISSQATIRPISGGAIADYGSSRIQWASDASATPTVTVIAPDGKKLSFRATFLALSDRVSGRTFFLAQVTNCAPQIVTPSTVLYANAFDRLCADLRYEYDGRRDALEQYVILRETPALPQGVEPKNLRLECWTEWLEGEPVSQQRSTILLGESGNRGRLEAAEENEEITFGAMKLTGNGKAFGIGEEAETIPVAKRLIMVDTEGAAPQGADRTQRRFLIETVDYLAAAPFLGRLVIDFCLQGCFPSPEGLISSWEGQWDAQDSAGGNHGKASGVIYATGEVAEGFNIPETGGFVSVSNAPSLNFQAGESFTIEGWIKPESAATKYNVQTIVDKRYTPSSSEAHGYALFLSEGRLAFQLADDSGGPGHFSTYGPVGNDLRDDQQWHHVAVAVNRLATDGLMFYIDGQPVQSFDPTAEPGNLSNTSPLFIGKHAQAGVNAGFKGGLDEISLYGRALLPGEIERLYDAGPAGKCGQCFPNGQCATPVNSMVGWWPGDGSPADLARNHPAIPVDGATYVPSKVGRGFFFNGSGAHAMIPRSADLDVGTGAGLTIEAWVTILDNESSPMFEWGSSNYAAVHFWANYPKPGAVYANIKGTDDISRGIGAFNALALNNPSHIALTYDRGSGVAKVYANGVLLHSDNLGNFVPKTDLDLYLGFRPIQKQDFHGIIDEPSIYNRALSEAEISAINAAGESGKCRATLFDPSDPDYDGVPSPPVTRARAVVGVPGSPPTLRLGYWNFNDANFLGERGQTPTIESGAESVVGWTGNAVKRAAGGLVYKAVENDGTANINCRQGIVRFRFSPQWSSAPMGSGPGEIGQLITVGGAWGISVNAAGTELAFVTSDGDGTGSGIRVTNLTASILWQSNQWYQVCLAYGPSESVLYVNGTIAQTGPGVSFFPPAWARAQYGLSIGSDHRGNLLAKGVFDELETFNQSARLRKVMINGDDGWHQSGNVANFLSRAPADAGWECWMSGNPFTVASTRRMCISPGVARIWTPWEHLLDYGSNVNISGISGPQQALYNRSPARVEAVHRNYEEYSFVYANPGPPSSRGPGGIVRRPNGTFVAINALVRSGDRTTVRTAADHLLAENDLVSIENVGEGWNVSNVAVLPPVRRIAQEFYIEYLAPGLAVEPETPDTGGRITRLGINTCNWPYVNFVERALTNRFEIFLLYAPSAGWASSLAAGELGMRNEAHPMAVFATHFNNTHARVQVLSGVRNPPCGVIPIGGGWWQSPGDHSISEGSWGPELEFVDAIWQTPALFDRAESWSFSATAARYAKLRDLHPEWNAFDLRQLLRETGTDFRPDQMNSGWTEEKGFGFPRVINRIGGPPAMTEAPIDRELSTLSAGDPLQIKLELSSDGKSATLTWKNFRQTGFEATAISGPANGGGSTTWYSGDGETTTWSATQDLRGHQPPNEVIFRTRLQDGRISPGFKVLIP